MKINYVKENNVCFLNVVDEGNVALIHMSFAYIIVTMYIIMIDRNIIKQNSNININLNVLITKMRQSTVSKL